MGFQLTVVEGKEVGKQISFQQSSVLVGRTDECDVILYDPGVSRVHCRFFAEAGGTWVEDMGSSNGTQVNGETVQRQRLLDGDAVKLGPVVFRFAEEVDLAEERTHIGPLMDEPSIADASTRIFDASEVRKSRLAAIQSVPPLLPSLFDEPPPIAEDKTTIKPLPTRRTSATPPPAAPPDDEGSPEDKTTIKPLPIRGTNPSGPSRLSAGSNPPGRGTPNPAALARSSGSSMPGGEGLARRPSAPRPARASGPTSSLSAAERARIRRESAGASGALRVWWIEASPRARRAAVLGGAALLVALLGLGFFAVMAGGAKGPAMKEPVALNSTPVEQSFGVGEGVTFPHPTQKLFEFEFNSAVRVVAVLHYQAKDISEGEVGISVNGAPLGSVPPDTLNSDTRPLEVIIPSSLLRKGEKNRILFAVSHKTQDPWRIWNLWVETAPLPEVSPEQLLRNAMDFYKSGVQAVDTENIDKRNRYRAWKYFRTAWLMLEGHPDPKPELYRLARDRMRTAQVELDNQCSKLLLEAEREYSAKDLGAANDTLNEIKNWFPAKDQPCPLRAEWTREKYGIF